MVQPIGKANTPPLRSAGIEDEDDDEDEYEARLCLPARIAAVDDQVAAGEIAAGIRG
jgi:hypothetical protein